MAIVRNAPPDELLKPSLLSLPSALRASVLGEYGGLGLQVEGHEWRPGAYFSYQAEEDPAALTQRYVELSDKVRGLMAGLGIEGSKITRINP